MGFLSGLAGAAGGFLTGGPAGAIAGGIGGFLSDEEPQRTTQGFQLRPYTEDERAAMDGAMEQLRGAMERMTPEQREQYIQKLAGTYYEPMAREINNSMATALGKSNAFQARGGMRGSSKAIASDERIARTGAGLLGEARARARQMGEQSFFRMQDDRRADAGSSMRIMDTIRAGRRGESPRFSTSTPYRPSGVSSGMGMIGYGLTSPDSYYNKSGGWDELFNKGDGPSPAVKNLMDWHKVGSF